MARRVSRKSQEQILMHKWWVRLIVTLAFIGIAYGFASLALSSGSLLEYAAALVFVWWALHHAIRVVRFGF